KSNKEETQETTCDIRLTGGDAPAFCQFDPFSLSYRCTFGVGESAVRLDDANPKYDKSKDGVLMFGLGEKVYKESDCLCCYKKTTEKKPSCIDLVTPQDILEAVEKRLE
ncbi:MAG: hypothetical protein AABX98_01400, partial [Nanoarchaeota archaeon]